MVSHSPNVSKDFPKLIKTLANLKNEFDYWDLVTLIYNNRNNPNKEIKSYFKNYRWVHLDKPYPVCHSLENDWNIIQSRFIDHINGTTFKIKHEKLVNTFNKFIENTELQDLTT